MVTIFYSSVMSSLMYAMVCTRPNISKLVEVVSRKMNNPSIENWQVVKWSLRYILNIIDVDLDFKQDKILSLCVARYTDSYYTNDLDKHHSITSYVFTLSRVPINWKSILQSKIALSMIEAKYMVVIKVVKEAIFLHGLLEDLWVSQ